jgi:hypothetical protein
VRVSLTTRYNKPKVIDKTFSLENGLIGYSEKYGYFGNRFKPIRSKKTKFL